MEVLSTFHLLFFLGQSAMPRVPAFSNIQCSLNDIFVCTSNNSAALTKGNFVLLI